MITLLQICIGGLGITDKKFFLFQMISEVFCDIQFYVYIHTEECRYILLGQP